jgi:hypothetical protein
VASLRFSRCVTSLSRGALLAVFALVASACVTVKPQDKELLSDPAMVYGSAGAAQRQEAHVLDNREGSMNSGASGGGCGCN